MLRTNPRARSNIVLEYVHAVVAQDHAAVTAYVARRTRVAGGVVVLDDDLVADGEGGRRRDVQLPRVRLAQEQHDLLGRPGREARQRWHRDGTVGIVELFLRHQTEVDETFRARFEKSRV